MFVVYCLTVTIPGIARGKDRARFAKGAKRPHTTAATLSAEDHMRAHVIQQVGQPMLQGALVLVMQVGMPVPSSWPADRRRRALEGLERPTVKPDWDNLGKLTDALNGVLWRDDSQIVDGRVVKVYASAPGTVLSISRPESYDGA
jgi:Holliday junction resolvase RusA-like endonuclease